MDRTTYERQLDAFISANVIQRPEFKHYFRYPCLEDDTDASTFDTHYVYHVAWAIRKILTLTPSKHYDISSSLHFCSAVASLVPTTFIDLRPASLQIHNLTCKGGDLTDSNQWNDEQYESVSCMHVVEHIGLGRYGDQLNVNGDLIAMNNLRRVVRSGGRLLFVVPVGRPAIFFNAHRVYSARWICDFFSSRFRLNEFYLIPGPTGIGPITNCELSASDSLGYGCGCFEFICEAS